MQMIYSMGGTPVWPLIALSNIAQGSTVIGIIIISRRHNERDVSVPAALSAMLGVTEPAMYGINLKYGFPMLCAMTESALAGLPGILSIKPMYWGIYLAAMAIAIVIPALLTMVVYRRKLRNATLPFQ